MGRLQLVLEPLLFDEIVRRAKRTGASRSLIARDLVRKGIEIEEDIQLGDVAESRWKTRKKRAVLSHEAVKRKFG
jgi:hypothetical protein